MRDRRHAPGGERWESGAVVARTEIGANSVPQRSAAQLSPGGAKKMRLLFLLALSLNLFGAGAVAAPATDPRGVWMVEDKSAQIEIESCNGVLWGVVVWERTPGHDTQNPNSALRGRPTLGMPILLGMRPAAPAGGG